MVGAFSVGKTALVDRYVHSHFSGIYLSTVGVKISKKDIDSSQGPVKLVLWDLEGRDDYGDVNVSYLRGSMGIILVVDGTREETLFAALNLKEKATALVGEIPYVLLINKYDINEEWEITPEIVSRLQEKYHNVFLTSAKSGDNVELAFKTLTEAMIK